MKRLKFYGIVALCCVLLLGITLGTVLPLILRDSRQRFSYESFSVTLTNEVSLALIDESIILDEPIVFMADFFPELNNITVSMHFFDKESIDNVRRQRMGEHVERPINQNNFRINMTVHLPRPNRQRVLQYIDILNNSNREDIEWVERIIFVWTA